jgi:hypothetical protein
LQISHNAVINATSSGSNFVVAESYDVGVHVSDAQGILGLDWRPGSFLLLRVF